MSRRLCLAFLSCLAAGSLLAAADTPPPRLAVIIVVDQMRADYIDRFLVDWRDGLKRLVTRGARFTNAAFPYLTTVTCAGHATIGSGALPMTHGVMQNTWFDRGRNTVVACTDDATVKAVAYGTDARGADSPASLRIPNFADEMRRQKNARVVSLSIKARSAIMLAGHGGTSVTWLSDSLDGWQTSTAYTAAPVPEVEAYVKSHPIEDDKGRRWARLLPSVRYRDIDDGLGEAPPEGWTNRFPHVLSGEKPREGGRTAPFYSQWERSPYADAYLGEMAAALVKSLRLGQRDTTDVLAVSFSSPDLVGHAFGPRSQEVQDMYARLDHTIGKLLDALDDTLGRDNYVVGLSADHGVTEIPEQIVAAGRDGGRLTGLSVSRMVEEVAAGALGPGRYVARVNGNDIYFAPGQYDALVAKPEALRAVVGAVSGISSVARVFTKAEMAAGATSADPLLRAAALNYVPDRSGDLVMALKPGWMFSATGTTHGSANPDDQRVPLLFYGRGITPGSYAEAATPADLAPTLARVVGITLPEATGRALGAALTPVPSSTASRQ